MENKMQKEKREKKEEKEKEKVGKKKNEKDGFQTHPSNSIAIKKKSVVWKITFPTEKEKIFEDTFFLTFHFLLKYRIVRSIRKKKKNILTIYGKSKSCWGVKPRVEDRESRETEKKEMRFLVFWKQEARSW